MNFSLILPLTVGLVGLILLIRLRLFFVLHPIKTTKEVLFAMREREVRESFFLALAGTIGVGNIFGVAAGLLIGGEGSLFWLFVSSFFAMIIKYAETLLVFSEKDQNCGMCGVILSSFSLYISYFSQKAAALSEGVFPSGTSVILNSGVVLISFS